MLRTAIDSLLSLAYPEVCPVCAQQIETAADGAACSACWEATRIFNGTETLCTKCGAFLFEGRSTQPAFCNKCDEHDFDLAFAIGLYEKALATSVLRLKREPKVSARLKSLINDRIDSIGIDPMVIIPVPLSKRRLHERGFNQASVISGLVGKHIGVSIDETSLARTVHTPMHRAGMDPKARAVTVKNAFEVVRPRLIEGRHVLLVDDVLTSGATVSMCAKVLKKSGATGISVMTIARA